MEGNSDVNFAEGAGVRLVQSVVVEGKIYMQWNKLVSGAVVLCQQSCGLRLGRRCAAALLVQGSAHVYSKKVEYLHQLVLQSLDAVGR